MNIDTFLSQSSFIDLALEVPLANIINCSFVVATTTTKTKLHCLLFRRQKSKLLGTENALVVPICIFYPDATKNKQFGPQETI